MLNTPSWTLVRTAVLLAAGIVLAPACGGSVEFSAAQGGAGGKGGGSSGGGGSPGAGSPGAGSPSGGGCNDVGCLNLGCGAGYKSVKEPGACCPTCVPDGSGGSGGGVSCATVDCPAIDCAQGYKWLSSADNCCGTCVPDPEACTKGQDAFQTLRKQLLADPSVHKCTTNADCTWLSDDFNCGNGCGGESVNVQSSKMLAAQLSQFAAQSCATCMIEPAPCEAPPPPFCDGQYCTYGGYL